MKINIFSNDSHFNYDCSTRNILKCIVISKKCLKNYSEYSSTDITILSIKYILKNLVPT